MDILIFVLGICLLILSANLALAEENPASSWSAWITGAGGVLAVVYGRFIAQPRAQVEESVRYLSRLKAVFLGYLRQLRQTDHAYTRRVLEDKPLDANETRGFNQLVDEVLQKAVLHLEAPPKPKADDNTIHPGERETPGK